MKSFTELNRAAGTKGFRPDDDNPTLAPNTTVKGKGAPKQSASGLINPMGDNDGANKRR
jgi:hypothetical protein